MAELDAKFVVCPYYHRSESNFIRCEGVNDDCTIKLTFEDSKKTKAYKKEFCKSMSNYNRCNLCRMLNEKYGVEDGV